MDGWGIPEVAIAYLVLVEPFAVEIKSFLAPSTISEFHTALGQFLNYRFGLKIKEPERKLFLAVPLEIYQDFFT